MAIDIKKQILSISGATNFVQKRDGYWMDAPDLDVVKTAGLMLENGGRLSTISAYIIEDEETEIIYHYYHEQQLIHIKTSHPAKRDRIHQPGTAGRRLDRTGNSGPVQGGFCGSPASQTPDPTGAIGTRILPRRRRRGRKGQEVTMPYTIPIGPYHPALEEPYKINVTCNGEAVQKVDIEIGFNFRSIELLAQRRNYIQDITLVERVCGICSNIHTMTFCMAAETIAGIELPDRARYIRVIIAELERLHSHLLWSGVAAELIGYQTMFMEIFALRESVMDVLEAISGNRVNYAMNCIGGVNRDITDPDGILKSIRGIRKGIETVVIPIFTTDATVKARTAGVGILTKEDAIAYGAVGPTARASGIEFDVRCHLPYAAYPELEPKLIVEQAGDVRARVVVRALEMLDGIRLIEKALQKIPGGPIRINERFPGIPAGEATARVEAPRGEVFYYIKADGSDIPQRVKIRTPTYVNMPSVEAMSRGTTVGGYALDSGIHRPMLFMHRPVIKPSGGWRDHRN